jgi:hypothetical protein
MSALFMRRSLGLSMRSEFGASNGPSGRGGGLFLVLIEGVEKGLVELREEEGERVVVWAVGVFLIQFRRRKRAAVVLCLVFFLGLGRGGARALDLSALRLRHREGHGLSVVMRVRVCLLSLSLESEAVAICC